MPAETRSHLSDAPSPRFRSRDGGPRPRSFGKAVSRRPRPEVPVSGADRPALDSRSHHHRLEPGVPLGKAARGADPSVRPDADGRDRHVVVSEQARGDHPPLDRARPGRCVPLRPELAISLWARPVYLRPFGEMNGHWNTYCAYTASGHAK